MVGFAHRAGIEKSRRADLFVARHMGMTMQEKIDAVRCGAGRNMDEEKPFTPALE